ncbi:HAD-IA family hydrolase [Planctomicrobium sp. SH527]|uniref:HAD-IA family hydrolase n=1 Tax=Planctomicrobium sp. SH527 TaxID=3448123 RepID=UPI003F5B74E9
MLWTCSALIFDLDGVLVDSNDTSERHWKVWAAQHGIPYSSIEAIHHGRPTIEIMRVVAPHLDAAAEASAKEDFEADDTAGLSAFAGAYRLMSSLPPTQWAIATSGKRRTATIRLKHTGLLIPNVFITANDITHGKPNPEPYLKAINQLGVAPGESVVIEDAPAGIQAGRGAGAKVIGVATTNPPELLADADVVLRKLDDIQLTVVGQQLQLLWPDSAVLFQRENRS